jgi:thimet oligopeptidase
MVVVSQILSFILGGMISDINSAVSLLPRDVLAAEDMVMQTLADAEGLKKELFAVPAYERTYENTVRAYDRFNQLLSVTGGLLSAFEYLSSDVEHRSAPLNRFRSAVVDLAEDRNFLTVFQEYQQGGGLIREALTEEQRYYFTKTIESFLVQGYGLSVDVFQQVIALGKEEAEVASKFSNTINADTSHIVCDESELTGVDPVFIAGQERDESGAVKLYCNYPTLQAVLEYCSNPKIRTLLFEAWNRRAYPENVATLESLIALRDARAKLLGFESYNAQRLSDLLIQTPEKAYAFLSSLEEPLRALAACDIAATQKTMPDDVVRDSEGRVLQADLSYVCTAHKQARYALDNRVIAEYFPVEKTIAGVFAIYEKFMNVAFEYVTVIPGAWSESVQGITVYTKDKKAVLGYIILDLYPRPYKFSHACCCDVYSRVNTQSDMPAVSLVIANFSQSVGDKPALLRHADVVTFFHEFGHAMHTVLSQTAHYGTRAFSVPNDFVELPSQILELWMWNRDMLKLVSAHYQTGQPLPDALIDQMLAANDFGTGIRELRQLFLSVYSLECFASGAQKDTTELLLRLSQKYSSGVVLNEHIRMHASFGHLDGYGPTYYGYALSRMYAHEVFSVIKKYGLLNPEIGERFVQCILKPGASKDANQLLIDFLGRPASTEAYIEWINSVLAQAQLPE